mmetsp:Transcript_26296/g.76371  ORF Transcript_26296/g.76371 Transcript_26296/m.76371 type:complete len:229 (+) Transcript_26296:1917-2603(+)
MTLPCASTRRRSTSVTIVSSCSERTSSPTSCKPSGAAGSTVTSISATVLLRPEALSVAASFRCSSAVACAALKLWSVSLSLCTPAVVLAGRPLTRKAERLSLGKVSCRLWDSPCQLTSSWHCCTRLCSSPVSSERETRSSGSISPATAWILPMTGKTSSSDRRYRAICEGSSAGRSCSCTSSSSVGAPSVGVARIVTACGVLCESTRFVHTHARSDGLGWQRRVAALT